MRAVLSHGLLLESPGQLADSQVPYLSTPRGALQNQHQFEVQQRQRAAEAFQQWSYQQQALANQQRAINAMNHPRNKL
jgi:hypothetical protein